MKGAGVQGTQQLHQPGGHDWREPGLSHEVCHGSHRVPGHNINQSSGGSNARVPRIENHVLCSTNTNSPQQRAEANHSRVSVCLPLVHTLKLPHCPLLSDTGAAEGKSPRREDLYAGADLAKKMHRPSLPSALVLRNAMASPPHPIRNTQRDHDPAQPPGPPCCPSPPPPLTAYRTTSSPPAPRPPRLHTYCVRVSPVVFSCV